MNLIKKVLVSLFNFIRYNMLAIYSIRNLSILKRNTNLKNKYSGRVFILATGSSVGEMDLSGLKKEHTIGVNRFFLHPQYENLDVDFFTCIVDWNYDKLWSNSWIVEMCFLKSKRSMKTFLHSSAFTYITNDKVDYEYRNKKSFFNKDNIHYVISGGSLLSADIIQNDIAKPCNIMSGSLYFSIGLAIYLGFDEVYLLGVDNSKHPMRVGHFYDGLDEVWDKDRLNSGPNPNQYNDMLDKQKKINKFAIENNIKIFNVVDSDYTSPIFASIGRAEFMRLIK